MGRLGESKDEGEKGVAEAFCSHFAPPSGWGAGFTILIM